jgi:predicted alpha-1,6-mannanase (GH76 family)
MTVMDIYERQGGEKYLIMIDDVFEGFKGFYPDFKNNSYNDDIGWWALGCTRAYALTNKTLYLNKAKEMFDYIYGNCDSVIGGGIYWNSERKGKNVCTNAPAVITAARLSDFLRDTTYLDKAKGIFDWLAANFYNSETGRIKDTFGVDETFYDGQYSYNYGTFAGAAYQLYLTTKDEKYLQYIEKPLDYLLSTKSDSDGILLSEGTGDGLAFRGIYLRTLNYVKGLYPKYQDVINKNALATYNIRRTSDSLIGDSWIEAPADGAVVMSVGVATYASLWQYFSAVLDRTAE